jgi:hypothetical protein
MLVMVITHPTMKDLYPEAVQLNIITRAPTKRMWTLSMKMTLK